MLYQPESSGRIERKHLGNEDGTRTASLVSLGNVFSGSYWDDFALTNFFRAGSQRTLVLGLGYGGLIRPLLTSHPCHITAIDMDGSTIEKAREIFALHFPEIVFEAIAADASSYVAASARVADRYDVVWVDCYDDAGYIPPLFTDSFWENVLDLVASDGVVALNSFGLPPHLDGIGSGTVTYALLHRLSRWFDVRVVPLRRNYTLLASKRHAPLQYEASPELRPFDALVLRSLFLRLEHALRIPIDAPPAIRDAPSFDSIAVEMRARWPAYLGALRTKAARALPQGLELNSQRELALLLSGSENGAPFLSELIENDAPEIIGLPIFIAAQKHTGNPNWRWFLDFFFHDRAIDALPVDRLVPYFLPNVVSLIASDDGAQAEYASMLDDFLGRLANAKRARA